MEEGGEVGMTNQEAAEMIRNDMKLHHDYLSGQYRKALNMAIDALLKEQEETISKREAEQRIGDLICIELKGRCPTWDDIHRALYD